MLLSNLSLIRNLLHPCERSIVIPLFVLVVRVATARAQISSAPRRRAAAFVVDYQGASGNRALK